MHAPVGHFFDVITNGFGAMPSYASRVEPDDRWRIIAYIRALQLSESASVADVPPDQLQTLTVEPPPRGVGPELRGSRRESPWSNSMTPSDTLRPKWSACSAAPYS